MPDRSTPLTRLCRILADAAASDPNMTRRKVLAAALNLRHDDDSEVAQAVVAIIGLIKQTSTLVDKLPQAEQDRFRPHIIEVGEIFSLRSLPEGWKQPKALLEHRNLLNLLYALDAVLMRHYSEPSVASEELSDLLQALDECDTQVVEDGDLSEEDKDLLFEQIGHLRRAVRGYNLRGVDGLRDALEHAIGAMMRRYYRDHQADAEQPRAVQKFAQVIRDTTEVVEASEEFVRSAFVLGGTAIVVASALLGRG